MKWSQYGGCESLSINNCEITWFQQAGDTISCLHTYNIYGLTVHKAKANIGNTTLILCWHKELILVHLCVKTQPTTYLSHFIAKHVPEMNMPAKLHINATYLMDLYEGFMCLCATYEVTSFNIVTRSTFHMTWKLHSILLEFITEQIWLPC